MADCLFCAINQEQLPAARVYEDEQCTVFLDLYPISHGHTLVISKHHAAQVAGLPEQQYLHMQQVAQRIVAAHRAWDSSILAHNWVINDGLVAGQHVPHVHLHLIPRRRGDKVKSLWRLTSRFHPFGVARRQAALAKLAQQLRQHLDHQA